MDHEWERLGYTTLFTHGPDFFVFVCSKCKVEAFCCSKKFSLMNIRYWRCPDNWNCYRIYEIFGISSASFNNNIIIPNEMPNMEPACLTDDEWLVCDILT